jgi:hypothetical protein
MDKESGTQKRSAGLPSPAEQSYEDIFQALPPLGSEEYVAHIRSAPASLLPAEVLVRAFRQLPAESEASLVTLQRLFQRRADGSWDYLKPLVAYARRQSPKMKQDGYEDLLQDGMRSILETLPTSRGAFAEQSWHTFCRQQLVNAWRERYGRRGERLPLEEPFESTEDDSGSKNPMDLVSRPPDWHAAVAPNQVAAIEKIAERVISQIPDEFVRSVAREAWFQTNRPRLSGRKKAADGNPSLTATFVGKSRFQIMRALRQADAQLAAALLSDRNLELTVDLQALLSRLKDKSTGSARARKESKK